MTTEQKLDLILAKLETMERWQQEHTGSHKVFDRDVREMRDDLYGAEGQSGIKARVQAIELNCDNYRRTFRPRPWWAMLLLGVAEKLIAGGLLAYLLWQLVLYRTTVGS